MDFLLLIPDVQMGNGFELEVKGFEFGVYVFFCALCG